jgi:enoyl-CoA hydratase
MAAEPAVLFEMKGEGIAVVTINRPKQMNSLNPEVVVRLAELFKKLSADDACRVIILTGSGDKVFSAGADLKRLITLITGARKPDDDWDQKLVADMSQANVALLRNDAAVEKPIIAAINGTALAGGCELVQGTDIRICADHAQIGLSEAKRGLFPAGGSTVRMPRQVPYARAMEILLTAEPISAQEAKEIGFVNYVVPKDQVMSKALEIAEKIASNGPVAVQYIRKSVKEILSEPSIAKAMQIETKHSGVVFKHPDAKEGPLAFAQKRKPVWGKSKL